MEPITSSYIDAALSLFQISENTNAITLLNKALYIDPKNSRAFVILGLLYQDSGKAEKAEKAFRKALKYEPENLDAHKGFGLFLLSQDRIEEGLEYLLKYIRLGQWEDITTLETILSLFEKAKNQEEIAYTFEEAWVKSLNPKVGFLLSRLLKEQTKYEKSLQVISLVSEHTGNHEYYNDWGIVLSILGRSQEAIHAFQKASDLATSNISDSDISEWSEESKKASANLPVYLANLAHTYLQIGDFNAALATIEHSLIHDKDYPFPWIIYVRALTMSEQNDLALIKAQEAISRFDDSGEDIKELYELLIDILKEKEDHQQYATYIQIARRKFPAEFTLQAIEQLATAGKVSESLTLLEDAIKEGVIKLSGEGSEIPHLINLFYFHSDIEEARKLAEQYIVPGSEEDRIELITLEAYDYLFDEDVDKHQKGLEYLKFIQSIFPNSYTSNIELSNFYIGKGDFGNAEEILAHLLEHTPIPHQHAVILNNMGYIYLLTGQYKKAITYLEKLIALNLEPSDINFSDRLGIALWKEGKVFPDYQPSGSPGSLQLVPFRNLSPSLSGRANAITLALATGDTKRAERWAMELISVDVSGLGFKLLGNVYLAKGELENAVWAWKIALEKSAQPEYTDLLIPEALEALIAEYSAK